MPTKLEVLRELSIGKRVAEEELEELARYFVETDQWRRIHAGEVDVVFGPKGGGKSALYGSLLQRAGDLSEQGVALLAGENLRGTPVFTDLAADPPTSEPEFVWLWKLYVLSLLSSFFDEQELEDDGVARIRELLAQEGLAPDEGGRRSLLSRVREYVRRIMNPEAVETEMKLDPSGHPTGFVARIVLAEPGPEQRQAGSVTVDELLEVAAAVLRRNGRHVWVMFDRLDVAFADNPQLEANALRALFKVYLDLLGTDEIRLKIFLRNDIWRAITEGGFREASHITRDLTITWTQASLLNLIVRRLLDNEPLREYYGIDRDAVLASAQAQREFFERLVPEKIDLGRNPLTYEWMLNRVSDGSGGAAPRELIHLLTKARDEQLGMIERGEGEPEGDLLFSRQAFRNALPEVGRVRLEQTLFAEYPGLRKYLELLRREKTEQDPRTLAKIWRITAGEARDVADKLAEVGFFLRRGKEDPTYWVPFLYRDALEMVQGVAE